MHMKKSTNFVRGIMGRDTSIVSVPKSIKTGIKPVEGSGDVSIIRHF